MKMKVLFTCLCMLVGLSANSAILQNEVKAEVTGKISNYWYALDGDPDGFDAVIIAPNAPYEGRQFDEWSTNPYNWFVANKLSFKIDGQTESSVTGWFSFRNDGDFVAKDDGTVLEYSKGGEHGDVATLDKFTGKLTLLKNDLTKRLINNRASENVSDALALPLCVRATYQDQEITVENGSFIVYVQRPLNAMAKEINASDYELHAWETDLKDIVTLYDWRGLSWGELKPDMNSGNGFYYYNVKSIVVTGANHVSDLPNVIQITKFDSGDYSTYYPLGDEKSNFTFSYSPQDRIDVDGYVTKTFGTFGVEWSSALESYNFNLKIPVTINYEWGTIESEVIIKFQGKPRCATPTITIKDGKLHFECETEGVQFKYDIQASGTLSGESSDLDIAQPYVVKVYATKDGYEDSDVATETINIIKGDTDGDGVVDIADAVRIVNLVVGKIPALAPRNENKLPDPE